MSPIRLRHAIPANESDFELLSLALLKEEWKNPGLELYAHRGEEQFGVDIFDSRGVEPIDAAQCKLHDPLKTIPPVEIKSEVEKAKKFRPKIGRYAILTSARASRQAHHAIIKINRSHANQKLFTVELKTWGKIETLLDQYDEVRDHFYSSISGSRAREISSKLTAIHDAVTSRPNDKAPHQTIAPAPLPTADRSRFAIAVAHLLHDRDCEQERLIVESLRDLSGVQIVQFDRTISADGPIPEQSERNAHGDAQGYLVESSADVIIWGTVLSHDGRTAPRLYWTTAKQSTRSRRPYIPENFQLPELFWDDLSEVLRLLVATQSAELFARRGKFTFKELAQFVERVRNALLPSSSSRSWSPKAKTTVKLILAMGFQQLGAQTRRREYLVEAVRCYRDVLAEWPLERFPSDWAVARNGLAISLGDLGSIEADTSCLIEALAVLRDLLSKSIEVPQLEISRAAIQNNLGNVLVLIGERQSDVKQLLEAAGTFGAAQMTWTRAQFPLDWAILQDHLGNALQLAGNLAGRNDLLSTAIEVHRSALEELREEEVPLYWAQTQNHLGSALKTLGGHQPGTDMLEEAATAFRMILDAQVLDEEPLSRAEVQNNLGGVLLEIANRSGDQSGIGEAVAVLRESLAARTLAAAPMAFASSKNHLGLALVRLGEFENAPRHFKEAIAALRDALSVWTRESVPARWAIANQNLGDAYLSLARSEKSLESVESARACYENALEVRDRQREPFYWASTQAALGQMHYLKGELEPNNASLESAAEHYKLALEACRPDTEPSAWAAAQFNLGNAERLLGIRTGQSSLIASALERHSAACRNSLPFSPYWAFRAAEAARKDIGLLESAPDAPSHQAALAKHAWVLTLQTEHSGHSIVLRPTFVVVVQGTTGEVEPDFSLAPRKGDRIADGSVTWENNGKFSFCIECNCFLPPQMIS
jgi:tetratricopeptide (TPR) repeat protein